MNIKEIWKAANPKGHLLTAISYLIPIVCGAGFIIAIGMAQNHQRAAGCLYQFNMTKMAYSL